MVAANEAHLAVQTQQMLSRSIGATQASLGAPRPEGGLAFLGPGPGGQAGSPRVGSDPRDKNRDGFVSVLESLGYDDPKPSIDLKPSIPAAWGSQTEMLPLRPRSSIPPSPPVGGPSNFYLPDPVAIVRENLFPPDMTHWGLPQRLGWLKAIAGPYIDSYWMKNRLAQAEGLLYEQYGRATGGPF